MKITLRDLILGGQDGLVNVLGIILGLFAAATSKHVIVIAGLAAAFPEAISMGAVAYTSARADKLRVEHEGTDGFFRSSLVVGLSALLGALIPIVPFLFLSSGIALSVSIVISAAILFALGAARGHHFKGSRVKSGLEVFLIGGIAAFSGFVIGFFLRMK